MDDKKILVWFRNDLRTHDNEILLRAVERSKYIIPVFCFDPRHFEETRYQTKKTGVLRASFIIANVLALKKSLKQLGGDLIITTGRPEEVLPALVSKYGISEVYHHREVAHEETRVSALLEEALWKYQINLKHFIGHTLYHKEDLPFPIKDIPDAFATFKKKTERESSIRPTLPRPTNVTLPDDIDIIEEVPTLVSLGYSEEEIALATKQQLPSGENEAIRTMIFFISNTRQVTEGFSRLSAFISLGVLSINFLYHTILENEDKMNKKEFDLCITKLLWRDYYRFMFKKHGNKFFQEAGFARDSPLKIDDDEENFIKWRNASTGQAVIDQAMRELNETGYIHEQYRVLLAAYLTQVLRVNWLKGAAWFEEKLVDYAPSNNYGNWAHIAGVGSSERENKPVDIQRIAATLSPKEPFLV